MLRVVVAEDSLLVREGVVTLLGDDAGIEVVGEVGDLRSLLDVATTSEPDVVVTDSRMPPAHGDEGIRAAALLRERLPDVGVVVLSQLGQQMIGRSPQARHHFRVPRLPRSTRCPPATLHQSPGYRRPWSTT